MGKWVRLGTVATAAVAAGAWAWAALRARVRSTAEARRRRRDLDVLLERDLADIGVEPGEARAWVRRGHWGAPPAA